MAALRGEYRRAISPLIATIILISITIAASLMVYSLYQSIVGIWGVQVNVQVISCDMIKTTSTTLISATVKNTGNKPITSCNIIIYLDASTMVTLNIGAIGVGETESASTTSLPAGASVTVGKSYPAEVVAAAEDGSTFRKAFSVVCSG